MQTEPTQAPTADRREFLTFVLGQEEYCIDILKVQEIRGYDAVTRIANAPDFIKGVINLRGNIVPIIDLRIKFRLGEVEYGGQTAVIVINVLGRTIGMVVDRVSDVMSLSHDRIKPAPEFGTALNTQYILGLAMLDDRMIIVINIEKLISSPEAQLIDEAGSAAPQSSGKV
jgi:purine-binding chemotaxis protein CheW